MTTAISTLPAAYRAELPQAPRPSVNQIATSTIMVVLLIASIWSVVSLGIDPTSMAQSLDNAQRFVGRMFPLSFPPLGDLVSLVLETLAIVLLATVLAVVLSLPVALFAAWNTTTGRFARGTARAIIVLARAVPDLVLAIFFFRVFGLGAVPGILAMGIHSVGMVGKLYADAIESLDNGPQEAVRSAGGSRWQGIFTAVIPQLMPQIIATALHRFDINLRTSVLLGYVGVGGIGLAMSDALNTLNFKRGMALALLVLLLCIATELVSGAIRAALMNSGAGKRGFGERFLDSLAHRDPSPGRLDPPWNGARILRFANLALVVLVIAASTLEVNVSWQAVRVGLSKLPNTLGQFFPPNLEPDIVAAVAGQMVVTVQIGLAATLLGSVLALPIGVLAARNVVANKALHTFFRVVIVVVRGIPELILAIIFVVISGLGGVAGTLALSIGAVGLLSKLVADSLEETDTGVQDAIRANGATGAQVFFAATLRQALPAFVAHILYLLDVNIRSATLLGIVGAGGVGYLLLNASRVIRFDVVTTIVLAILLVVLLVEALSIWVRRMVR